MRPAERRWFDEAVARRAASSGASAAVIARRLEARLAAGEPLQYVLGTWSFRGHELRVDHRALIPRYETEQLVEHVLAAVRTGMRVLDVGTGSGAIAISLALEGPRLEVTGSDVDPRALALARENVRATGAPVTLVRRSWFEGAEPESLDVVVANPPYVAASEWERLDPAVRVFEPRVALVPGPSGLEGPMAVIGGARVALRPGGWLFMEIGETQGERLVAEASAQGYGDVTVERDLAGRPRVLVARWPGATRAAS